MYETYARRARGVPGSAAAQAAYGSKRFIRPPLYARTRMPTTLSRETYD